jgi:hypothetical protein
VEILRWGQADGILSLRFSRVCARHSSAQQLFCCGVHPTCSVSTTRSADGGPSDPCSPPDRSTSRTQYVVPGLSGAASIFVRDADAVAADVDVADSLAPPSHESGYSFHCSTYEAPLPTFSNGWNWTVIDVCAIKANKDGKKGQEYERRSK